MISWRGRCTRTVAQYRLGWASMLPTTCSNGDRPGPRVTAGRMEGTWDIPGLCLLAVGRAPRARRLADGTTNTVQATSAQKGCPQSWPRPGFTLGRGPRGVCENFQRDSLASATERRGCGAAAALPLRHSSCSAAEGRGGSGAAHPTACVRLSPSTPHSELFGFPRGLCDPKPCSAAFARAVTAPGTTAAMPLL